MSYYKDTVHGLIEPLINGQVDLTLTYNVDEVETYLLLLCLLSILFKISCFLFIFMLTFQY